MQHEWDSAANTELFNCVRFNDVIGVEAALASGADIEAKNGLLETPLILAIRLDKWNAFCYLLENNASPDARNCNSQNALQVVEYWQRGEEWVERLKRVAGTGFEVDQAVREAATAKEQRSQKHSDNTYMQGRIDRSR
jgi:hypothetical protein